MAFGVQETPGAQNLVKIVWWSWYFVTFPDFMEITYKCDIMNIS